MFRVVEQYINSCDDKFFIGSLEKYHFLTSNYVFGVLNDSWRLTLTKVVACEELCTKEVYLKMLTGYLRTHTQDQGASEVNKLLGLVARLQSQHSGGRGQKIVSLRPTWVT